MLRAILFTLAFATLTAGCGKTSNHGQVTRARPITRTSAPGQNAQGPSVHISNGKPLTQAQWIARGDAICAKLISQTNPLKVKNTNEIPRLIPQEVIYIHAELAALSKLTPPANKANDWQKLLNLKQEWANGIARVAANFESLRKQANNPFLRTLASTRTRANKLALQNGFKKCSQT